MFHSYLGESILARAIKDKKIKVEFYDLRKFTTHKHRNLDGKPYGGGPGMVMLAQPVLDAWHKAKGRKKNVKTLMFSPGGDMLSNQTARTWSQDYKHIILICGRYEGIDARVKEITGATEISIGEDYVLTGGELPAMITIDVMARQIPGVLGSYDSLEEERVSSREVYTRPEVLKWKGKNYGVPEVLLSGNHAKIDDWRKDR